MLKNLMSNRGKRCLFKSVVCLFLLALVSGCGGGGGSSSTAADTTAPMSIAGTWDIDDVIGSNSCGITVGYENIYSIMFTQNDNEFTVESPVGTFSGRIEGNQFSWGGSFPEDGGTTTILSMDLTLASDGNRFNGTFSWSWTDGNTTCSGMTYTAGILQSNGGGDDGRPGGGGSGPGSSPGDGTRPGDGGDIAPTAPTSLTVGDATETTLHVSWTDNSDNESGFRIERSSTSSSTGFSLIANTGVDTQTYNDSGLTASTTYWYRISAFNAAGDSAFSNIASATTQAHSTDAPVLAVGSINAWGQFPFEWTYTFSGSDMTTDGYEFQESETSATSDFVTLFSTVGEDDQESPKQIWVTPEGIGDRFYRVRANDDGAATSWSNVVTITSSGSQTLNLAPVEDYYILWSNLNTNNVGTFEGNSLNVGCNWDVYSTGDTNTQTYICSASVFKYDLAPLTGKAIDSATLTITTDYTGVGNHPRDWVLRVPAEYWNNTITYDTLFEMNLYSDYDHLLSYPIYPGQPYTLNVIETVRSWVDGTFGNNGWAIFSEDYSYPLGVNYAVQSLDSYGFYGRTGDTPPILTVTYH